MHPSSNEMLSNFLCFSDLLIIKDSIFSLFVKFVKTKHHGVSLPGQTAAQIMWRKTARSFAIYAVPQSMSVIKVSVFGIDDNLLIFIQSNIIIKYIITIILFYSPLNWPHLMVSLWEENIRLKMTVYQTILWFKYLICKKILIPKSYHSISRSTILLTFLQWCTS